MEDSAGRMFSTHTVTLLKSLVFLRLLEIRIWKVRNIFGEISVNVNERDIQVCHQLREKDRTIVKFVNSKDYRKILGVKKDLKHLDPSKLFFSERT